MMTLRVRRVHLVWASLLAGMAPDAGAQGSLNSRVPRRFALGADAVLESAKPDAAPYYAPSGGGYGSDSRPVPGLQAMQRSDRGSGTHFDPKDSFADPELLSGTAVAGKGNSQNPFSHRIPIALPPGINGVQPELALVYDPNGGNGMLGVGWKLDGLSAITRVNNGQGINYDGQDTYSHSELGILVKQSDGSYRSRKESFAQLTTSGPCNDGPCSWVVTDRAGRTFYYGRTASSRLLRGASVRTWALERVEDPFGNSYDIWYESYAKDSGGNLYRKGGGALGRLYPDAVTYTNRTDLSGQRRVEFEYEPREDTELGFPQKVAQQTVGRLRRVIVKSKNALVREYRLSYQPSPTTGRSRLVSVQEYGSQGGALPAQTFEWQDGGVAFTYRTVTLADDARVMLADFNGDGRTDIGHVRAETRLVGNKETKEAVTDTIFAVSLSTGNQFSSAQDWKFWSGSTTETDDFEPVGTADVDGDGKADLIAIKTCTYVAGKESIDHYLRSAVWLRSTGAGFGDPAVLCGDPSGSTSPSNWKLRIGDFNGDRRADVACAADQYPGLGTIAGDFNGDGKTELARAETGQIAIDVWDASRSQFVNVKWPVSFSGYLTYAGDFNGDGLSDLAAREGYNWSLLLSNGAGFNVPIPVPFERTDSVTVGDFDGDGRTEIASWYNGKLEAHQFTGLGFRRQDIPTNGISSPTSLPQAGDFTGQGRHGLTVSLPLSTTAKTVQVLMADLGSAGGLFADVLTAVHNGLGGHVYATYRPATEVAGAIQPYSTGPGVPDTTPTMLVTRVTASDNRGGNRWTDYSYKDRRRLLGTIDQARDLGFANIDAVEAMAGRTLRQVRNLYRQDWPFERLAYDVTELDGDGFVVSQWQYGYDNCQAPQGACLETKASLGQGTELVLESGSTVTEAEKGVTGYQRTAAYVYGKYANVKKVTRGASGRPTVVVEVWYLDPDPACWNLGRIKELKVSDGAAPSQPLKWATFDWTGPRLAARREWLDTTGGWLATTFPEYDVYGNLREVRGPVTAAGLQRITRLEYDPANPSDLVQVTEILDPADRLRDLTTVATYYGDGTLKTVADPNGATTSYEYDQFGRKSVEKRPDGGESRYGYLLAGQAGPDPADAENPTAAALYNRTVTWLDPSRTVVRYEYFDGSGFVYWTHTRAECAPGQSCAGMTQELPVIVRHVKDAAGRETQTSTPHYPGQPVLSTLTTYDARSRPQTVTTPDGKATEYAYGTNYTEIKDPNLKVTRTYVNARGSVTQVVAAQGTSLQQTTSYGYDALERPTSMTPAGQQPLVFTYDSLGRRTSLTDPQVGSRAVTFSYDALNRVKSQTSADGKVVQLFYDTSDVPELDDNGKGRLVRVVDGSGTTRFQYTSMGQMKKVSRETAGAPVLPRQYQLEQSYAYNWLGQVTRVAYPEGTVVGYSYTGSANLDRVFFGDTPPADDSPSLIARWWGYDARGNPGSVKYAAGGATTTYGYDVMGHLTSLSTAGNGATLQNLTYDWYSGNNTGGLNLGQITDLQNAAASETYQYDDLYRLTQATGIWGNRTYTGYDAIGNLGNFGGLANRVLTFDGQQLKTLNGLSGSVAHDAYGNLTQKQLDGNTWKYQWSAENFLASVEKNGVKVASMTYDAWGQRATKASATVATLYFGRTYERQIRLDGTMGQETIYLYANGQLIAHATNQRSSTVASALPKTLRTELAAASLYDGRSLSGAARKAYHWLNAAALHPRAARAVGWSACLLFLAWVLAALLASRRGQQPLRSGYRPALRLASLGVLMSFTLTACGPGAPGEEEAGGGVGSRQSSLVSTITSTAAMYFYHRNQVGSTTLVTDAVGALVAKYVYLPFGEKDDAHSKIVPVDANGNPLPPVDSPNVTPRKFTGQERDDETGLDYYNARYYDPSIGRFISADTIIPDVLNGQAFNRYAYVGNNPIMRNDPSGHVIDTVADAVFVGMDIGLAIGHALMGNWKAAAIDVTALGIDLACAGVPVVTGGGLAYRAARAEEEALVHLYSGAKVAEQEIVKAEQLGTKAASQARTMEFTDRNLQKGFTKHGTDFGLTGNWNPSRGEEFRQAVLEHINKPGVQAIPGTYRGDPVTHFLDPKTGLNVMKDPKGNYVSGWKLGAEQLESVMKSGRLF